MWKLLFSTWRGIYVLVVVCWAPLFLLGKSAFVTVGDVLDCEWIWLHLLDKHGLLFGGRSSVIPEPMGGLEVGRIHSPFNLNRVIWMVCGSNYGYSVAVMFYRCVAVWGAWTLVRYWRERSGLKMDLPSALVVLGWGLLPTSNLYGLSALGLPLLVYMFETISVARRMWVYILGFFCFGFVTHMAMFLVAAMCIVLFYLYRNCKDWNATSIRRTMLGGVALLSGLVLANFWQFQGLLFPLEVSHRVERVFDAGLLDGFSWTWYVLTHGHYHSGLFPGAYVLTLGTLSVIFDRARSYVHVGVFLIGYLLVTIAFHSARPFASFMEMNILQQFDLQRINFLLPFLAMGVVLFSFWGKKHIRLLSCLLWVGMLCWGNHEIKSNWKQLVFERGDDVEYLDRLLDEEIWAEVVDDLEYGNRVGISGLPMWVAQFHGIKTLGGYQNDYPLSYKHEFREVIIEELQRDEDMLHRFDTWGNSCWLQSSEVRELGLNRDRESMVKRGQYPEGFGIDPWWNWQKMKDLDCTHVISAYPIISEGNLSLLSLRRSFFFDIYVYRLL